MALVEKAFGDIITFTRASGGGRINSLGQYEWTAANVPRLTHDPVTLQPLGLLVEEQRTNLLLWNSDFTNAAWSKLGSTAITPLVKGQRIDFPANLDLAVQATQSIAANTPHTVFVIAARDSGKCTLRISNGASTQTVRATIDTSARTLTFKSVSGTGVFVSTSVVSFESGWDIYALTGSFTSAQTGMGMMLVRELSAETTITVLGAQFEAAPAPSSHIPTGASQVIRAADVPVVNTLAPWFNATDGTIAIEFIRSSVSKYACFVSFEGAGSNIRLESGIGAPAQQRLLILDAGVTQAQLTAVAPGVAGALCKMAGSYKANSFAMSQNGSSALTDVDGTIPAVTSLRIGMDSVSNQINGIIRSITYYPHVIDVQQASA